MHTITLKKTVIELYSSIKELPIHRQMEAEALGLIDVGVGSTMSHFNNHLSMLYSYLANSKWEDAKQESTNLHNNAFYMIEKIGIDSFSLCAYIKSIDGVPYIETELQEYRATIEKLSNLGLTYGDCEDTINSIKKKLTMNLDATLLIDSITAEQFKQIKN